MTIESIDRIAPTRRPLDRLAGYQQWRSLLFLHWPMPVDLLRRLVPAALTLDLYEGTAYVGVVPFAMQAVRPWWISPRLALRFLETNVRTYVLYRDRPGVYFFSLDASSRLAVAGARTGWGLPYHFARMSLVRSENEFTSFTQRRSNGAVHHARYRVGEALGASEPGTLQHFLLERYLLFVQRGGRIFTGQVHHTPYPVQSVEVLAVQEELIAAAGFPAVQGPPALAHYSPGVDVEIFPLRSR